MQPKAAKKIGGMTPKKMTGGKVFDFEGTDYEITKDITQDGKLRICVETAMPGAEVKKDDGTMVTSDVADAEAAAGPVTKEGSQTNEDGNTEVSIGGKKKRKSSKKRKSMKKKGGMKRKSMKVKA